MSNKKTALVNENVIRRWGKLASIPALTESFLDTVEEQEEEGEEEEALGGLDDAPADAEAAPEAAPEEEAAVERIVSAVVDAIASETGVDIEIEGEAGDGGEMSD